MVTGPHKLQLVFGPSDKVWKKWDLPVDRPELSQYKAEAIANVLGTQMQETWNIVENARLDACAFTTTKPANSAATGGSTCAASEQTSQATDLTNEGPSDEEEDVDSYVGSRTPGV